MQIGIKIVSIWGGALLLALALRSLLPRWPVFHITWKRGSFVLPYPPNRLAFWFCIIVGLVLGAISMVKAMLQDLGRP